MTLQEKEYQLYTYNQNDDNALLNVSNHTHAAADNVIFIPLYEETRKLRLSLVNPEEHKISWLDEELSATDLKFQQRMQWGGLLFALKPRDSPWDLAPEIIPETCCSNLSDDLSRPAANSYRAGLRGVRQLWFLLSAFVLLVVLMVGYSSVFKLPFTSQAKVQYSTIDVDEIKRWLSGANVRWLQVRVSGANQIAVLVLSKQALPDLQVSELIRKQLPVHFPVLKKVEVLYHSIEEIKDRLKTLFLLSGIDYGIHSSADVIYISVQQKLSPEQLDFLHQRLKMFEVIWGKNVVNVNIHLPEARQHKIQTTELEYGNEKLVWDKSHILIQRPTITPRQ